jgi:hypothetical protein
VGSVYVLKKDRRFCFFKGFENNCVTDDGSLTLSCFQKNSDHQIQQPNCFENIKKKASDLLTHTHTHTILFH